MLPADVLTSDPFMSHVRNRIDKCAELASLTYDALEFVEMCSYVTLMQWGDGENTEHDPAQYRDNIERINISLREVDCCMPPLHVTPCNNHASNQTDLSRKLLLLCVSVRDVVPALLSLRIPAITALLSAEYEKLERKLAALMLLQYKVLMLVPIVRRNFIKSRHYIDSINGCVNDFNLRELIFIVGAYENRLLRFRVHNYVVHDDDDAL